MLKTLRIAGPVWQHEAENILRTQRFCGEHGHEGGIDPAGDTDDGV